MNPFRTVPFVISLGLLAFLAGCGSVRERSATFTASVGARDALRRVIKNSADIDPKTVTIRLKCVNSKGSTVVDKTAVTVTVDLPAKDTLTCDGELVSFNEINLGQLYTSATPCIAGPMCQFEAITQLLAGPTVEIEVASSTRFTLSPQSAVGTIVFQYLVSVTSSGTKTGTLGKVTDVEGEINDQPNPAQITDLTLTADGFTIAYTLTGAGTLQLWDATTKASIYSGPAQAALDVVNDGLQNFDYATLQKNGVLVQLSDSKGSSDTETFTSFQ